MTSCCCQRVYVESECHDNVWLGYEPETVVETCNVPETADASNVLGTATVLVIRTFCVRLLKSLTVLSNKEVTVPVYISYPQMH